MAIVTEQIDLNININISTFRCIKYTQQENLMKTLKN